eukprot:TRINITY_DN12116_c0_g1_i1.p1 TRINITY_DN12116_c0_g1~~TRINITY_DN12116_c0_g1_i1.p1  ORF type:complete len:305 (-),score=60.09 TRINITY_DN12116_c0_g1_i1:43-957(-)
MNSEQQIQQIQMPVLAGKLSSEVPLNVVRTAQVKKGVSFLKALMGSAMFRTAEDLKKQDCALCLDSGCDLELRCSHVFHRDCIANQLTAGWTGPRISFNFMRCAVCRSSIALQKHDVDKLNVPALDAIKNKIVEHVTLAKTIRKLAEAALAENKEVEASDVSRMVFYPCFKCKTPYYAGQLDCAAEMNLQAENLLCKRCMTEYERSQEPGKPGGPCSVHGYKFALFKCGFCCNPATWQCGSREFYCAACHDGIGTKLPCAGPDCYIKIPHSEGGGGVLVLECGACQVGTDCDDVGVLAYEVTQE